MDARCSGAVVSGAVHPSAHGGHSAGPPARQQGGLPVPHTPPQATHTTQTLGIPVRDDDTEHTQMHSQSQRHIRYCVWIRCNALRCVAGRA